jgi:Ras GTPase-activating-like protein IQGAP2/3
MPEIKPSHSSSQTDSPTSEVSYCVNCLNRPRLTLLRDPHADEKALWVQAKRGVLAILRVQPAQDLVESLMRPVTEDDELLWEVILENEMENEHVRQIPRRQPSTTAAESAYRLEDIRS